jgi:hypothetical protein
MKNNNKDNDPIADIIREETMSDAEKQARQQSKMREKFMDLVADQTEQGYSLEEARTRAKTMLGMDDDMSFKKGGTAKKKKKTSKDKEKSGMLIVIGGGKGKCAMKDGGSVQGKKHMYAAGGNVTDNLPNKGLKKLANTPKGKKAVRKMGFDV